MNNADQFASIAAGLLGLGLIVGAVIVTLRLFHGLMALYFP